MTPRSARSSASAMSCWRGAARSNVPRSSRRRRGGSATSGRASVRTSSGIFQRVPSPRYGGPLVSFETAIQQWQAGERRLRAARAEDPDLGRALDRVTNAVVNELRRRLGGPLTAGELVDLYEAGADRWPSLARSVPPHRPPPGG